MIYLATTGSAKFWDLDSEIALLGPWCEGGLEDIDHPVSYTLAPTFWKSQSQLRESARECYQVTNQILAILIPWLNDALGVQKKDVFWNVYLEYWLFHFVQIVHDRATHIKAFKDSVASFSTTLTAPYQGFARLSASFPIQAQFIANDLYNLALFSGVCRFFGVKGDQVDLRDADSFDEKTAFRIKASNGRVKDFGLRLYRHLFRNNPILVSGPRSGSARDYLLDTFLKRSVVHIPEPDCSVIQPAELNRSLRENLGHYEAGNDLIDLVFYLLPDFMPSDYLEGFESVCEKSISHYGSKSRHVVTWAGWGRSSAFDFYAGECAADGKKLVSGQHGGVYGHYESAPLEFTEAEAKDGFLTWGWKGVKEDRRNTYRPFPDRRLSDMKNTYTGGSESILYLGTCHLKYMYRLHTGPTPHDFPMYIADIVRFLRGLSLDTFNNVLFKPNHAGQWDVNEILESERCLPKLTTGGDTAPEIMVRAGLVVIDHPATAFIESMVINAPTLLFWDPELWPMRPDADPYFDQLSAAGILHDDPTQAANKCESIIMDTSAWWKSEAVQTARLNFIDQYGLTSEDWLADWRKLQEDILEDRM